MISKDLKEFSTFYIYLIRLSYPPGVAIVSLRAFRRFYHHINDNDNDDDDDDDNNYN